MGAELPPALAEAGAPYARVVVLFDGNIAEELALARVFWCGAFRRLIGSKMRVDAGKRNLETMPENFALVGDSPRIKGI